MRYVGLGRDNLRSHFVFRPRHAPEWLRAWFLPVVFLTNEEELTRKTFTTSLTTTNPNTYYVKFIILRTSTLKIDSELVDEKKDVLEELVYAYEQKGENVYCTTRASCRRAEKYWGIMWKGPCPFALAQHTEKFGILPNVSSLCSSSVVLLNHWRGA